MSLGVRYSRQMLFPEIGPGGQERLLNSKVAVIGCGALGAMQLEMLARAGIGRLKAVDRDFVDMTNLQRQIMFTEADAANHTPKAVAVGRYIQAINSEIETETLVTDINYTNIEHIIKDVDLVIDGTDNFETRYLLNDACVKQHKPWIYGAAVSSYGLSMTIRPQETPCLRCVFEQAPPPGSAPTCDTAGVILPIIAMIAAIQVTEALKLLTGNIAALHGNLIQIDVWKSSYQQIKMGGLREQGNCRCCQQHLYDFLELQEHQLLTSLCGRNAVQIVPAQAVKISLTELAQRLAGQGDVTSNKFLVRFKLDNYEMTIFSDARSLIHGTNDLALARSLYAKYIGV